MESPSGQHPFNRKYIGGPEHRMIESTCALCGFRIVGSVTHTLKEDEDGHAATCPKMKSAKTKDTAAS